jgi:hypothetical protein
VRNIRIAIGAAVVAAAVGMTVPAHADTESCSIIVGTDVCTVSRNLPGDVALGIVEGQDNGSGFPSTPTGVGVECGGGKISVITDVNGAGSTPVLVPVPGLSC